GAQLVPVDVEQFAQLADGDAGDLDVGGDGGPVAVGAGEGLVAIDDEGRADPAVDLHGGDERGVLGLVLDAVYGGDAAGPGFGPVLDEGDGVGADRLHSPTVQR